MKTKLNVALMATVAIIVVCVAMMMRISRRLIVDIDGVSINSTTLRVGQGGDICFDQIPSDYMTITWQGDDAGYHWQVSDKYIKADSLCYYKINGRNPNLHLMGGASTISVDHAGKKAQLTIKQIEEALKGTDNRYVMLANVLAKTYPEDGWETREKLRSFVYRNDDGLHLMILDTSTTLDGTGYCSEGATASLTPSEAAWCKVQFFGIRTNNYRLSSVDKSTFHLGDINHTMKPVVITTEWGAGHVTIHHDGDTDEIRFPKAVTYAERIDSLRKWGKKDRRFTMLTIHQTDQSLPQSETVYVPAFCGAVRPDVMHITLSGDSTMVGTHLARSRWHLLPDTDHVDISAGPASVHLRTGIIATPFLLSYLWLPLIVFVILMAAYPYLTDASKAPGKSSVSTWSMHLPHYFAVILTIALAYCMCKTLIALKLSFTYPYFEKITGITVVATALMLLLITLLSLVLNHDFLTLPRKRNAGGKQRKWVAVGVGAAVLLLCIWAFRTMDEGYNAATLAAYLPGETMSLNPLAWMKSEAINDLHRSVPLMLILANMVTLALLCVLNTIHSIMPRGWHLQQRINAWTDRYEARSTRRMRGYHGWGHRILMMMLTTLFFLVRYAALPALIIMVISLAPGNFSTAFITLGVIIGYSYTLSSIDYNQQRMIVFLEMLATSVVYLAAAMLFGDKGYLTNYFGFFLTFMLLYFMLLKSKSGYAKDPEERRAEERELKAIPYLAIGALVVALALPWLIGLVGNPEKVSYDRSNRRISMFAQYDDYLNSGYRYAVSDGEFMTVMMHSMFNNDGSDPLNNDHHPLHPSVSTGQSPVVLNDLSMPCAFVGGYGWMAYIPYFGLLAILAYTVLYFGIRPTMHQRDLMYLDMRTLWRILTMFMWLGTTLYLYLSYVGQLPFTGRLNPGLGIDSVGEALETSILLAFMTATKARQGTVNN